MGGSFIFPPAEIPLNEIRRVVFVAGGVGINPFASMLGHIADKGCGLDVRVLYSTKTPAHGLSGVLFLERINRWFEEKKLGGDLKVFNTGGYEKSEDKTGFDVLKRRFTIQDVREAIGGQEEETIVYVCGPAMMTDEIVDGLTKDGGMDKERVMLEKWW